MIGPRPTLRYQVDRYDERQRHRLDVKPGITGWAQIHGRAELPWADRIELDLWYVEHRSPRARPEDPAPDAARALRRHLQGRDRWLEAVGLAAAGRSSRSARSSSSSAPGTRRTTRRARATTRTTTWTTPTGSSRAGTCRTTTGRVLHAARLLPDRRHRPTGSQADGLGNPDRAGAGRSTSLFLLGTVLLVAAIARELWPGRRRIELGAAAFVAFLPVAVEAEAMFHPEPLSLFLSTLALWLCVRTFADRRYAWALGLTLGAHAARARVGALRVGAALLALLVGRRWRELAIVLVLAVAIPAPWYIHQRTDLRRPAAFTQPAQGKPLPAVVLLRPRAADRRSRRPTASTTTPAGSPSPTTGSGATTSASGPGTRTSRSTPKRRYVHPSRSAKRSLRAPVAPRARADAARGRRLGASRAGRRCDGRRRLPSRSCRSSGSPATSTSPSLYWTPDGDLLKATYMLTTAGGLGPRLRLRARPPPRPLVARDARRARRRRARRAPVPLLSVSVRACPRGSGRARAGAPSRARPRSGAGRRRSPPGRTAG